jgi:hypothetical protein
MDRDIVNPEGTRQTVMAINRRFLYAGLFLMAIGAVLVAADLAAVTRGVILQALQLWPLALIAIGAAVVVRRTSISLPAGVLGAVAPGLLIGGSFALGPPEAGECGTTQAPAPTLVREGTAARGGIIELRTGCGSSTIATAPGSAWRISAAHTDGTQPDVSDTGDGISITSPGGGGRQLMFGTGREVWDVVLPTTPIEHLAVTANANQMAVRLPGADLGALSITANASDVNVDATGATLDQLDASVSFSTASIRLPAITHSGEIRVRAGGLQLCQPPSSGLRVTFTGDGPREVTVAGLHYERDEWQGGNILSSHQIQLFVDVDFGSVDINPVGGCA